MFEGNHVSSDDNEAPREEDDSKVQELLRRRGDELAKLRDLHGQFITWSMELGPLQFSAQVGSHTITLVFIAWHLLAGAAGTVITIIWPSNKELGVALIVGALFGFGSFLAQFWSQAVDKETEFIVKTFAERDIKELRATIGRLVKIDRKLDKQFGKE